MFFPWFEFWVWLLTAAFACAAIVVYGIATIRYRFAEEALEVVVLGVVFRRIPYAGIETADRGGSLWHEHWVTFRLDRLVSLRLREGRHRMVVVTPPDPQAFLQELTARLNRQDAKGATGTADR
jgi:hypothetical protein